MTRRRYGASMASVPSKLARTAPSSPSAAQARIVAAALELFAQHGVGGTSLQMIADEIGVTKAAVYHQFNTKDEIVIAVAEDELAGLEAIVVAAEAQPTRAEAREALIDAMVDRTVERGRLMSTVQRDPVIVRYFARDPHYRDVMRRLYRILMGNDDRPHARATAAMLTAAMAGAVTHPIVADLDDDTLRRQLRRLARRFLNLPE
jgi:AcrR family transcriptional regulator